MLCIICRGFLEKGAIAHYSCMQDEINCHQYQIEYILSAKAFMSKYGYLHQKPTTIFKPELDPLAKEVDDAYNAIVADYQNKLQNLIDILKVEQLKYQSGYNSYVELNRRYEACITLMEAKSNFRMLRYITNDCMSLYVNDYDNYMRCQTKIKMHQGAKLWITVAKLDWYNYVLSLSSIYTTAKSRTVVHAYLETMKNINTNYNIHSDTFLIRYNLCDFAERTLDAVENGYKK
jgi:hypothetical protein